MIEEYVDIGGLSPTNVVDDTDLVVVRKGLTDRRINISDFKDSILPLASTNTRGIVQLSTSTSSSSINTAATSSAVKDAYSKAVEAVNRTSIVEVELDGKANAVHTHHTSSITSGVFPTNRLPKATSYSHGIVRPTSNLALSSDQGYVASIEMVKYLQQQVDQLSTQLNDLELGTAFTPLPSQSFNNGLKNYPIGTTLMVNAGPFVPPRNSEMAVYVALSNDSTAFGTGVLGANAIGMFNNNGQSIHRLSGTWVSRGAAVPVPIFSNRKLQGVDRNGQAWSEYINCSILMQRIA